MQVYSLGPDAGGRLAVRRTKLTKVFCCSLLQVAPNSDGIQKLLAAEQEASRIVAEARKGAGSCCELPTWS